MGAVLQSHLLDLAATTLDKTPTNEYVNALVYQSYIFNQFMKDAGIRDMSGKKLTFNAMIKGDENDTDDAADGVGVYGAYEVLGSEAVEYQETGEVPWCYYEVHWVLSSQEAQHNKGKEGFIDLAKSKVEGCMTRLANVLENHFWSRTSYAHASSAKPWVLGPNYWITDDGYHINDAGGTGHVEVGGLDPANSTWGSRWRNQTASISTMNEMPDALDDMFVDCKFVGPPKVEMADQPQFKRFRIVMDKTTFKAYKKLQKRLKDNVGADVAAGKPVFNNVTLEMADRIPSRGDSTYETFFFNMDTWKAYVDRGNNFRRGSVITPSNQDVRLQRIFYWPTIACVNRPMNGKIYNYAGTVNEG